MANYATLKAAVQDVVKTNGNKTITGANLQSTLLSIINSLGTGYQFMGVATPSTTPGTPDYNVAYIGGAGTYANFGTSVTVPPASIGLFKYNGSWIKEQIALGDGVEYYISENFNKSLITSASDVQLCNASMSTQAYLTSGSTCLASTKRKKLVIPSIIDVTCTDGYGYYLAFCQNYGNGNVSLNVAYNLTERANLYTSSGTYTIPANTEAVFVIIKKADGSTIASTDYDKVEFVIRDEWIYEQITPKLESIDHLNDGLSYERTLTSQNDWQNAMIAPSGASSSSSTTLCTKNKIKLVKNEYINVSVESGYKYRVIFFSSYNAGTINPPTSYTVVAGDYDDLTIWHTDARMLQIPSAATCYTVTLRKIDDTDIAVSECTNVNIVNNFGTDNAKYIESLKNNAKFNAYSLFINKNISPYDYGGLKIDYEYNDTYHVYGTTTTGIEKQIIGASNVIPQGLEAGKTIYIGGMSFKCRFRIREYVSGTTTKITDLYNPTYYTISSNITGINVSFLISSDITIDEHITPIILNTYSNEDLFDAVKWNIENDKNLLLLNYVSSSSSRNGITYTYYGGEWNVSGTSTATSWIVIKGSGTTMPSGIEAGKLLKLIYSGTDVALHVVQYDNNGNTIHSDFFYSDSVVSIDELTKGVEVRLRVASGVTLDEDVTPVLINHLNEGDLSKEMYQLKRGEQEDSRQERIMQCAKSYYVMTRANQYTYGKRSALYFPDADPDYDPSTDTEINQVHCGGLSALMASGCTFFASRYNNPNGVNGSYTAGYGFDFEAYSLKLAHNNVQSEIDYIGSANVNKTVAELKELMLFKTSYQLSTSCLRWNMIEYIQTGSTIDLSKIKIGDILFYGNANSGQQQWIDGHYIYPVLIEGNLITHCDTVIKIENGTPYVIDAGAAPISIHAFNQSSSFSYVCVGRVPLFDIIM